MSAFICSDAHIATIACWASNNAETAQEVADALLAENIKSVNFRYNEDTEIVSCDLSAARTDMTAADVVALCEGLEYQSCEHPDHRSGMLRMVQAHALRASGGKAADLWSI